MVPRAGCMVARARDCRPAEKTASAPAGVGRAAADVGQTSGDAVSRPRAAESRRAGRGMPNPAGGVLVATGVVVLEHPRRGPAPASAGALIRTRIVDSGGSALSFYELHSRH